MSVSSPDVLMIRGAAVMSRGRIGSVTLAPPIGIAYLAGYAESLGYTVQCIDAFGEDPMQSTEVDYYDVLGITNEEVIRRIPSGVRVFAITCMFSNEWVYLRQLIEEIRARHPDSVICMGGEHATALSQYVLDTCPAIDFIIKGEGEFPFGQLLDVVIRGKGKLEDIVGLVRREGEEIEWINGQKSPAWTDNAMNIRLDKKNQGGRIKDLDQLPYPSWNLLPLNSYLDHGIATITARGSRTLPIIASRGCPYTCKFCSNPDMWGRRYTLRSPAQVIDELKFFMERYEINRFEIIDLTFIVKKSWVIEFATRLIDEDLGLKWNVPTTRSEAIDEEVVALLAKSGCTNLCLTPDSGSVRQLEEMEKMVDLEEVSKTLQVLLDQDITVKLNLVIGFPNETHKDILQSILYGIRVSLQGAPSVLFYPFVPYPGSAYFDLVQERKQLPELGPDFDRFLVTNIYNEIATMRSYSQNVGSLSLRTYVSMGYLVCFLSYVGSHPREVPGIARRVVTKTPQSQIELLMISLLEKMTPDKVKSAGGRVRGLGSRLRAAL